MIPGRPVKLFKDGRNRALRISRDLKFPGEEAIVSKEGDRLIIEPAPAQSYSDQELFWIINNGIRFTGMPG